MVLLTLLIVNLVLVEDLANAHISLYKTKQSFYDTLLGHVKEGKEILSLN